MSAGVRLVTSAATRIDDRAPGREPRVAQCVAAELPDRRLIGVVNVHCTNSPDPAICDAELERVLAWVVETPSLILAGDFNVTPERSAVLRELGRAFSSPIAESIDQILVRGAKVSSVRVWPEDERRFGGSLLSDHAVVEAEI